MEDRTVARAKPHLECGEFVGSLAIVLKETQKMEIIKFNCTRPKHHNDRCAFVGDTLLVLRKKL